MPPVPQKPQSTSSPRPPSRMTLSSLVKGRQQQPIRVLLYGPEGIGKSTFGANAPRPIFLGAEDGTASLDVVRFPRPDSLEDVHDAIALLRSPDGESFDTLVVDTLDWLEPLIWDFVVKRDGEKSIESYGYGKGYIAAIDEWRKLLRALESVARRMHVVLLAHSMIRPFKNPTGEDFDRYELKLHAKAAGLVKEWTDAVLFAQYETYAKKDEKTKRVRGIDTGARLVFTERRAAYDAKNRYSLPESLPLSWSDFAAAVAQGQTAAPAELRAEVLRKAEGLPEDVKVKVQEVVAKAGDNAQSLALINNKVNAKLAEMAEKETVQ